MDYIQRNNVDLKGWRSLIMNRCSIIFGGTGFIGTFFAKEVLSKNLVEKVYLVDIEDFKDKENSFLNSYAQKNEFIEFIYGDVREKLDHIKVSEKIEFICNFAAVHREPGHEYHEYFDTNIPGAKNVCEYATNNNCKKIFFTSSISPYGESEDLKDESYPPKPTSPYGKSKLQAECIHKEWLRISSENKLIIIRPGVVYGPGEGGNVTRLLKAVRGFYFFYMGNHQTRKAGIYIKELCNILIWENNRLNKFEINFSLLNATFDPAPSVEEYVKTICKVGNYERIFPNIGFSLIFTFSYILNFLYKIIGKKSEIDPVRVRKLIKSNNISPNYLKKNGYLFLYSLEGAFRDWKKENPKDW